MNGTPLSDGTMVVNPARNRDRDISYHRKRYVLEGLNFDGQSSRDDVSRRVLPTPSTQELVPKSVTQVRTEIHSTEQLNNTASQDVVKVSANGHSSKRTPKRKRNQVQQTEAVTPARQKSSEDLRTPAKKHDKSKITPPKTPDKSGRRGSKDKASKETSTKTNQGTRTQQSFQNSNLRQEKKKRSPEKLHDFSEPRRASLGDFIAKDLSNGTKDCETARQIQAISDGSPTKRSRGSKTASKFITSTELKPTRGNKEEFSAKDSDSALKYNLTSKDASDSKPESASLTNLSKSEVVSEIGPSLPAQIGTNPLPLRQTDWAKETSENHKVTCAGSESAEHTKERESLEDPMLNTLSRVAERQETVPARTTSNQDQSEQIESDTGMKHHEDVVQHRNAQEHVGQGRLLENENLRLQIRIPATGTPIIPGLGSVEFSPPAGFMMTNPPSSSHTERSVESIENTEERSPRLGKKSGLTEMGKAGNAEEQPRDLALQRSAETISRVVEDVAHAKVRNMTPPRPAIPLRPIRAARATVAITNANTQKNSPEHKSAVRSSNPTSQNSPEGQVSHSIGNVPEEISPRLSYSEAARGRRSMTVSPSSPEASKDTSTLSENHQDEVLFAKSSEPSPTSVSKPVRDLHSEAQSQSSLTTKSKGLKIGVPLRTPSPSPTPMPVTLPESAASSPQGQKDKQIIVLKDSTVVASSPPIPTHLKKKRGPTPTKTEFSKKAQATAKTKSKVVNEASSEPSEQPKPTFNEPTTTKENAQPGVYPAIDQANAAYSAPPLIQHSRESSVASTLKTDFANPAPVDQEATLPEQSTKQSKSKKKKKKAKSKARNRQTSDSIEASIPEPSVLSVEHTLSRLPSPPGHLILRSDEEATSPPLQPLPSPFSAARNDPMSNLKMQEKSAEQKAGDTFALIRMLELQEASRKAQQGGRELRFIEANEEPSRNVQLRESTNAQPSISLLQGASEYYDRKGAYSRLFAPSLVNMVKNCHENNPSAVEDVQAGAGLGIELETCNQLVTDGAARDADASLHSVRDLEKTPNTEPTAQIKVGTIDEDLQTSRVIVTNASPATDDPSEASGLYPGPTSVAPEDGAETREFDLASRLRERFSKRTAGNEKKPGKTNSEEAETLPSISESTIVPRHAPALERTGESLFASGLPDPTTVAAVSSAWRPKLQTAAATIRQGITDGAAEVTAEQMQSLKDVLVSSPFLGTPGTAPPLDRFEAHRVKAIQHLENLSARVADDLPTNCSEADCSLIALPPTAKVTHFDDAAATVDLLEAENTVLPPSPDPVRTFQDNEPKLLAKAVPLESEGDVSSPTTSVLSELNVTRHDRSISPKSLPERQSRHRPADSTSTSEYSTTSSTRRFLYSEIAASNRNTRTRTRGSSVSDLRQ